MSLDTNKDNFRIFINECNQDKLKDFLANNRCGFIKSTKESILNCLDIQEFIIENIKGDDILSFIAEYYKFEKEEISLNNKKCKRNSERFETLMKQGNAVFFMINPNTMKFTFSKGKGLRKLGLGQDEVIGKSITDYYGNNETIMNGVNQAAKGVERYGALNAGRFDFDVNFTPVFDEDGNVEKIVGMAFDISKHVELEKKLEEANSAKDKFFSIIAHDLKGPFGVVLNFSELLKNDLKDLSMDEIKTSIGLISKSTAKSYNLLIRLLDWAKVNSSIKFNPENFDLHYNTIEQIKVLEEMANIKNIVIENEIPENTIINADKDMINMTIRNLISNSIKFSGGEGKDGKIFVSMKNKLDHLLISISDNGIGMYPQQKENLFKMDKMISTKGTTNEDGSGLGLLFCKEFIERHGGNIRVAKSKPGKGTVIKFSIPILDEEKKIIKTRFQ